MPKKEPIVRYSARDLAAKRQRGETQSDWARASAMTAEEIERDIASDPDEAGMVVDWNSVSVRLPEPKADLHMRIDRDVLEFFRKTACAATRRSMRCCAPMSKRRATDDAPMGHHGEPEFSELLTPSP